MQEAQQAKEKMHGKLVCGRPLIVRLASEKYLMEGGENSSKAVGGETAKPYLSGGSLTRMSRGAKIAAIKNKLKSMEEESHISKRQKPADSSSHSSND
nr:probable RNA-binding protein 18 isoform X2 [Ipomoea batatas]